MIIVENDKGEPRLLIQHEESDIHIDKKTATTRWRGERMDYSIAVESLVTKWRRGRSVPAETG